MAPSAFVAIVASSAAAATMTSTVAIMLDLSIYTIYVNVHLSIDKLDGTDYDTWTLDIELWLKSQCYVDHLTRPNLAENEVSRWLKIDAQLCIVIKSTIHSFLKQFFRTYETCLKQNYYTPMILNVFMVCVKIFSKLLLPNVLMVQWRNIWVNFMLFFMILMSYYLLPPLILKN